MNESRAVTKKVVWLLEGKEIATETNTYPLCKFPKRDCETSFRLGRELVCDVYGSDSCPFVDEVSYVCSKCGDTRVGELWYGCGDCGLNELDPVPGGLGGCGDLHNWVLVK